MPGEPALWTLARKGEAEGSLLVKAVDGGGRPLMEGSWEIRFANGRGGRAEGWGGEGIGQAIFTVPLVRGRGAVLTVKAAGAGEGSVGLDALPIGTESLDVV
ncbi:MAG: hypothetical protein L6R43_09160, partial [Planctomycetes bacterium]|nr:hypothetical protein [Planctomycetota bacterium]